MFPFPFSFVAPTASGIGTVDNVYSMDFDGINDYFDVPTISLGTEQTLSWWIYRNSSSTQECPFGDTTSGLADMLVYMNRKTLFYRVGSSSLAWSNALTTALTDQKWCNLVVTRNAASAKLYINSTFVSEQTLTGGNITAPVQVDRIGASSAGINTSFYINGKMDNVALFTRELSQDQISEIYNATSTGVTADLDTLDTPPVAWYRMGD